MHSIYLSHDFTTYELTLSDEARYPPFWCSTRLHSLLGAVTFTMAVNCLLVVCSRKEAHSTPSNLLPKGPTGVIHAPLSQMCQSLIHTHTHKIVIHGHRQPQGSEIFINPLQASGREQGHYFCYCLKKRKICKNQLSHHRRGARWHALGGLRSWRTELELCAALSNLQSQFEWFKALAHLPSSVSSPSNSPQGGSLSSITEGLSEVVRGGWDFNIWIAFAVNTFMGLRQRVAMNSQWNPDRKRV